MSKILFDSHTHINNEEYTEESREALIREIEASDVSMVMDIGFDWPSSLQAVKDAGSYPWCYAVVGVHPHDAKTMNEEMLDDIRKLAQAEPKVKAIGEIGLDFYYDLSERDVQREWFRRQIRLANELHMPIVIHAREADQETMDILVEEGAFSDERKSWFPERKTPAEPTVYETEQGERTADFTKAKGDARVVIHCFSGSRELALQYVKLGATIGICGPVTYKNNRKTVEVCQAVPVEFLMAETDAPYLTPVPFRGKPNKSPYVEYTVKKIAEIKGISYEEAAEKTAENGRVFFNI